MPTQNRSSSSIAVRRKREIILFDCGEGTQKRMVEARLGFRRPMKILISHLHGDHVLGLPGLIQTMTLLKRKRPLEIFGPQGMVTFIQVFSYILGKPNFEIQVFEVESKGIIYDGKEYDIITVNADHEAPAWSFVLEEHPRPGRFYPEKAKSLGVPEGPLWKKLQLGDDIKLRDGSIVSSLEVVGPSRDGLKIAYSGDTRPSDAFAEIAAGADLLIHEATFDSSLLQKANENLHSTARQAAEIAANAKVKMLVLTHISSRYPKPNILLEEAWDVFPATIVAEDLLRLELPYPFVK
jgi:ribonuclease Z